MQRVSTLLDKIRELNKNPDIGLIEIDLMLDYTKVLYADLLEWRNKTAFTQAHTLPAEGKEMEAIPDIPAQPDAVPVGQPLDAASPQATAPGVEPIILHPQMQTVRQARGKNIRSLIGINDKYQFISELFGNNREAYDAMLNEINGFDNEEEALSWIHTNVYSQYGWTDENETLSTFYRTLSVFFSER
jgi:hypothetical protein